jgi:DNA (cytosine-5)-methyltransferase 1
MVKSSCEKTKDKLRVLDLFCGCGGMSTGLEEAGLNIVGGLDIWDKAIDSYKQNFDHLSVCDDISILTPNSFSVKYNISDIDIIVGGPPCQGFSIAGKRDVKDPRNSLFMEYVKYLNYFNPKAFIMENVMGILSMKNASKIKVIDIIMEELNKNYNCIICKLYASDFEVPQNRRRVIIIGIRKDLDIIPTEPTPILTKENRIPVGTIILPKEEVDVKNFLSERALNGIKAKKEKSKKNGNGFGAQFLNMDKPSYTIPGRYWKDGYDALVAYSDTEVRRLTLLELKRIQSFSDEFVLVGNKKEQIMQIGNAVASRFAYHLGKHVISILQ